MTNNNFFDNENGFLAVSLRNGLLLLPRNYVLIQETMTETSNYAAVVTSERGNFPNYVFFSDESFFYLTPEKRKAILDFAWEKMMRDKRYAEQAEEENVYYNNGALLDKRTDDVIQFLHLFPIEEVLTEGVIIREV